MTNSNDLLKLLVSAVFGAILTLIVSNNIERMKIKEGFKSEFNKIRVQKIGETWEFLNTLSADTEEFYKLSIKLSNKSNYLVGDSTAYLNDSNRFENLSKTVLIDDNEYYNVIHNRFWIGEVQYKIALDFQKLIMKEQEAYMNNRYDDLTKINDSINFKRLELDKAIENTLKGR